MDQIKQMARRVARRKLFADLVPPLGYPGGPCHVVQRVRRQISNPRLENRLVNLVESGSSLSNPQAAQVYGLETEKGVWKFRHLYLTAHAQYRMDLRGVTVPEVRLALGRFFRHFNQLRSRGEDGRDLEEKLARATKIEWTDPRLRLTLVFAREGREGLRLITVYWKGQPDLPPVTSCPT